MYNTSLTNTHLTVFVRACVCRLWNVASSQCTATPGRVDEESSDDDEDGGKNKPAAKVDATLDGHKSSVCSVAISGDGRTLVSGSHDHTVK
jgi:WD40 repeat protein